VNELGHRTSEVVEAVLAGAHVVLSVRGEPVADIVQPGQRTRWLAGGCLGEQLR